MNTFFSRIAKNFQKKFLLALTAALSVAGGFFVANMAFAVAPDVAVSPIMVKGGSEGTTYSFAFTNNLTAPIYDITITAPAGFTITDHLVCPTGWAIQSFDASSVECTGNGDPTKGLFIPVGSSANISFSATAPANDSVEPWIIETVDNTYAHHPYNLITTVDATAPTTAVSETDTEWHQGSVLITLTPSDVGGSEVASTHYKINDGGWNLYTDPFEVSNQGINSVSYYSVDGVGNTEEVKTVGSIMIDNLAPETTLTVGENKSGTDPIYIKSDTQISLSAIDDGSQGIVTTYSVDGGEAVTYTGPFTLSAPGAHPIAYQSEDLVHNGEITKTVSVFVDDLAPTIGSVVISPISGSFISGLSDISAPVNDAEGSGVANCEYTLDGGANWTLIADGACAATGIDTKTASSINIRATDKLGNSAEGAPVEVTPDFTKPITTDSGTDAKWHNADVTVTLTPGIDASGIAETKYKINDGAWNTYAAPFVVSAEGENTISYYSVDKVGNAETAHNTEYTVKIDKTAPTITDNNVSGWKNTTSAVTLAPSDALSLIAGVKYCEGESCDVSEGTILVSPYTLPFDTDGVKTIRYQTADVAGNLSAIGTFTVQTDMTVPASSVLGSVEPKHTVSSINYVRGTVTLSATADDTVSGIAKVVFYHSSVTPGIIGEDTSAPYSLSWDTTSVSNDAHEVYAVAYDQAGNTLESAHFPITVDNEMPTLLTNTLSGGYSMSDGKMAFSPNDDSVMDIIDIDTAFSEKVDYVINIKSGSTIVKSWDGTAINPESKPWNGLDAEDGIYTVEITATDHAGNTLTDTSKTILVDNTAPAVEVGADIITAANENISASANDTGSEIMTYSWTGDEGLVFSSASEKDTNISADEDGVYSATLTVTDHVGNHASDTLTFTKDTAEPTITISSPAADAVYKTNENILAFTASDIGTAITCSYQIGEGTSVSTPCDESASLSGLVDGRNTVTVTVTDAAGNHITSDPVSFVYDSNNTLTVGTTGADFTTIQEAITKATAGDTIQVAAGAYTEVGQIVINKNLSIVGADKNTTIIKPAQNTTGDSTNNAAWILVQPGVTFNLSNTTLDGDSPTRLTNWAIATYGTGTIDNNIIKNVKYEKYAGRGVVDFGTATISNNLFENIERIGVHVRGAYSGSAVGNATVIGNTFVGKGDGDWLDYGIEVGAGATADIQNNIISKATGVASVDGSTSAGILVTDYYGTGTSATITGNTISNSTDGIAVGYSNTDNSAVVAHNNKFIGNTFGIESTHPLVDASQNFWGDATGPKHNSNVSGLGNEVSDFVSYRPWYLTADLTDLDETAPAVTLSSTVTSPTNVSSIPVTIAWGEPVTGFDESDISVTNGEISDFTDAGFTVTPIENGDVTVSVAEERAADLSGNYNTASNVLSFIYDSVAPTAEITYSPETLTNQDVIATMNADEDVTVTSEGGSSHTFAENGEFTFTFVDAAGNEASATAEVDYIDKTAPAMIALSGSPASLTNSTGTDITVGGTDVVAYQYKLDDGAYGEEASVEDSIALSELSDGSHTLSVIGRDEAGNWQETAATHTWTIETVVPTVVTKTPSVNAVGIDSHSDIVVTFSEAVTIAPENITIKKGDALIPATVAFDSNTKTVTIHGSLEGNSTYTVTLLTSITDLAGNALTETSWSFTTSVNYSIALTNGWNLVSIPVVPGNTAVASVLGTAKDNIETVWSYDPTKSTNGGWSVYHANSSETSDLASMTAGYGYWINYTGTNAGSLIGSGNLVQEGNSVPPSRKLKEGWNLIGYYQRPNTTSVSADSALYNNLNSVWTLLFGYDNTNKHITTLDGSSLLNPGEAFWIWLDGDRSYTMGNTED